MTFIKTRQHTTGAIEAPVFTIIPQNYSWKRSDYRNPAQKRWIRSQASCNSGVAVA
jgi:hypothetical protein